jgi:hypothetical protein
MGASLLAAAAEEDAAASLAIAAGAAAEVELREIEARLARAAASSSPSASAAVHSLGYDPLAAVEGPPVSTAPPCQLAATLVAAAGDADATEGACARDVCVCACEGCVCCRRRVLTAAPLTVCAFARAALLAALAARHVALSREALRLGGLAGAASRAADASL